MIDHGRTSNLSRRRTAFFLAISRGYEKKLPIASAAGIVNSVGPRMKRSFFLAVFLTACSGSPGADDGPERPGFPIAGDDGRDGLAMLEALALEDSAVEYLDDDAGVPEQLDAALFEQLDAAVADAGEPEQLDAGADACVPNSCDPGACGAAACPPLVEGGECVPDALCRVALSPDCPPGCTSLGAVAGHLFWRCDPAHPGFLHCAGEAGAFALCDCWP